MLTPDQLKAMPPGTIFAEGVAFDCPGDLNMTGSGRQLRWVACRGKGMPDWAIYCHYATYDAQYVQRFGDKVHFEDHIRKLVPCFDEAYQMYRH